MVWLPVTGSWPVEKSFAEPGTRTRVSTGPGSSIVTGASLFLCQLEVSLPFVYFLCYRCQSFSLLVKSESAFCLFSLLQGPVFLFISWRQVGLLLQGPVFLLISWRCWPLCLSVSQVWNCSHKRDTFWQARANRAVSVHNFICGELDSERFATLSLPSLPRCAPDPSFLSVCLSLFLSLTSFCFWKLVSSCTSLSVCLLYLSVSPNRISPSWAKAGRKNKQNNNNNLCLVHCPHSFILSPSLSQQN